MKYETRLIWILGITFGVVFFDRNAVNYLIPFITVDLHLSNQQVGLVASALSFSWAIGGFLGGAFSDRTGNRKAFLLLTVVVFSACSLLSGLASSFLALFLARLLMGLSEGPILPIAQSLVAFESADSRRGFNMGVMQNFGSSLLGSFLAPLVLVALANAWSWRAAFFIAGIPGVIMALFIARYVHEPAVHELHFDSPKHADAKMSHGDMLRFRNMWLCMAMSIVMVAWLVLGWAFLPLFYVKVRLLSATEMSVLMSVLGISSAFFSFIVPGLSDRIGRRPVVIAFSLIGLGVPIAALWFHGSLYILALLMFLGWSASGTFPLFMGTIPSETIPARYLGTSLGMVMGAGEILGGVTAPAGAGWAADRYGLEAPIMIQAGCAIVATVLAVFLRETAPVRCGAAATATPTALTP